ncbi:hypothetical protein KCP75_22560 [Salmonella enterica subsp. enterica]|nr:hypothetical protein KCP75_22560 [Salmonella enterica subsp. enterica]
MDNHTGGPSSTAMRGRMAARLPLARFRVEINRGRLQRQRWRIRSASKSAILVGSGSSR